MYKVHWLLLTDMRHGRLLRCSATKHDRCHVVECELFENDYPLKEHEVTSPLHKRAGITYGIEDRDDAEERRHFVRRINQWLPVAMTKYDIERITAIAPSRFLGELRARLNPKIIKQLDLRKGEWVHLPIRELMGHPLVRELVGI